MAIALFTQKDIDDAVKLRTEKILRLVDDLEGQVTESGYLSYSSPHGQWVRKETVEKLIQENFGVEI